MSNKKRSRKGIESIKEQIDVHNIKLQRARDDDRPELAGYYEKEISHLEQAKERLEKRIEPKLKRKKL